MRFVTRLLTLLLAALALLPAGAASFHLQAGPALGSGYAQPAIRVADAGRFEWMPSFYPTTVRSAPATWPAFALSAATLPAAFAFNKPVALPLQDPTPTLSLFPNPARGLVSVQLTAQHGPDYKLRLSNVLGREVRLMPLPLTTASIGLPLDVSNLPAGLYFCSLLVNDKAVSTNRLTLL